jgi:hypothetical protein
LFAGLALLGIAFTIWADASNRRISRKPLVVCQINGDRPVTFDDPNTTQPRAIRVGFKLDVSALNDVAMNVSIEATIRSSSWTRSFESVAVPVPLPATGTPHPVDFALRLNNSDIEKVVDGYRKDGQLVLTISASTDSLEGIRWSTSFDYLLRFRPSDRDKIEALVGEDVTYQELWAKQVTVQADHSVAPGTWKHRKL